MATMRFQLKFKDDASAEARQLILEGLAERGAGPAQAVFPSSTDNYRSSLYVVDTGRAGKRRLVRYLKDTGAVEILEPEVRHRLAAGR